MLEAAIAHMYPLFDVAQKVEPIQGGRIAAGIFSRYGKLEAIGTNSYKTHPMQAKYAQRPACIHLHAEIDAIRRFLMRHPPRDLINKSMVVVRAKRSQDKQWITGLAKPCSGCMSALNAYSFHSVYYTIEGTKKCPIKLQNECLFMEP